MTWGIMCEKHENEAKKNSSQFVTITENTNDDFVRVNIHIKSDLDVDHLSCVNFYIFSSMIYWTKYSRMDQVKFVEDSL